MNIPDFTYDRGAAVCRWSDPATEFSFDRVLTDRRSGEVTAELAVWITAPTRALLHRGRLNLLSTTSRATFAKHLAGRHAGPDWAGLLEVGSFRVVDASRKGRAPLVLATAQRPPASTDLFGAELPIPLDDPIVFHGDGGDMKSFTALAIAAAVASGRSVIEGLAPLGQRRVAYLDWEWTAYKHAQRLRRLCPSGAPDVLYVPCGSEGPLSGQVDRLRDIFREHQITWCVVDSVALACAGPPEEAAVALDFFQSLSRLEVGSALIAHTNRAGDVSRPFGSQFWHNSVRASWHVKAEKRQGGMVVTLTNKKRNDGPLCDPLALAYTFTEEAVTVRRIGAAQYVASESTSRERMESALRSSGPMTYQTLADTTGLSYPVVKKLANEGRGRSFVMLDSAPGSRAVLVDIIRTGTVAPSETPFDLNQTDRTPYRTPTVPRTQAVGERTVPPSRGSIDPGGTGTQPSPALEVTEEESEETTPDFLDDVAEGER